MCNESIVHMIHHTIALESHIFVTFCYIYISALQYLLEVGSLLHFNEQLQGLGSLYFLDPVWLQELLALITGDSALNPKSAERVLLRIFKEGHQR